MLVALGRRELIAAVGSAAIVWPFTARAQHPANPVVGILSSGSYSAFADLVGAFRTGLTETGYIERQERRHRVAVGGGSLRAPAESHC